MSAPDSDRVARPRRVTMGSGLALVSCLLLVLSMLDAMARMRSVETRRSVEEALSTPPGSGLGIEVETVLTLLRGMVLLTGGLAAAGVVLAVFTLQRHRGARVGLTVVAVVMLLTATFVSGLLPVVVAIGALMLWSREARDWFSGAPARSDPHVSTPSSVSSTARSSGAPGSTGSTGSTAATWPPPLEGGPSSPPAAPQQGEEPGPDRPSSSPWTQPAGQPYGQPVPPPYGQPGEQPYGQPVPPPYGQQGGQPYGQVPGSSYGWPSGGPGAPRRPVPVAVAAWLTWVFSGITMLFLLLLVVVLMADQDQLVAAMRDNPQLEANGYTTQQLLGALWVISAIGLFWCLSAIVLAVLAYRRVNAGRIGLVVSAGFAGLLGVVTVVGLVHAVAAFGTVVLLFTGGANRWYAGQEPIGRQDPRAPRPEQPPVPRSDGKPPVW